MNNNTIHINDLSIGYHQALLENICVRVDSPKLIFIIGKNGSGKSTLLHTVTGWLPALKGTVLLNQQPVNQLSLSKKSLLIAHVFSKTFIPFNLSVFEVVALGRTPYLNVFGKLQKADIEIINRFIDFLGLKKYKDKPIQSLSDGEQQLVFIARALVQDTPFIVLDEPTTFLDFSNAYKVMEYLKKLTDLYQKTVLLSSHNLSLIKPFADQLWVTDKSSKKLHVFENKEISPNDLYRFFDAPVPTW